MTTTTTTTATIHRCPVIVTKYLGPTNTKGSRVKATAGGGASVLLSWDYELNEADNHAAAAIALIEKRWGYPSDTVTLRGGACHGGGDLFAWAVSRPGVFA